MKRQEYTSMSIMFSNGSTYRTTSHQGWFHSLINSGYEKRLSKSQRKKLIRILKTELHNIKLGKLKGGTEK
jgi:hypothetical protein